MICPNFCTEDCGQVTACEKGVKLGYNCPLKAERDY